MFVRVLLAAAILPALVFTGGKMAFGLERDARVIAEDRPVLPGELQGAQAKIPSYFIDGDAHSGGDEFSKLKSFKIAIRTGNLVEAKELLRALQTSSRPKIILEVIKIRLNRKGAFHHPQTAVALIHKLVTDDAPQKAEAAYRAGIYFQRAHSIVEKKLAIDWFERAATWGVDHAHVRLGELHSKNSPALRDLLKALRYYRKAAETVSVAPIMSFARQILRLSSDQEDCGIDPHRLAAEFLPALRAEASSGKLMAAKELGRLYLKGAFVRRDPGEARKWLHFAAQAGDPGAIYDLARIDLKSPGKTAAISDATKLLSLAADNGNAGAYLSLARLYLIRNSPADDREAFELVQKAADAGSPNAVTVLKNIYQGEKVLGQNPERIGRLYAAIQTIEGSVRKTTAVAANPAPLILNLADSTNPLIDPIMSGSINTDGPTRRSGGLEGNSELDGCAFPENY